MTIPLEVHSCYSMLAGVAWPRQLVARAVEYGMTALALTDTDGLYGAVAFYQAAKAAGIKPILGARLGPLLLLARDREGYAQLCALITAVHLDRLDVAQPEQWPEACATDHLFLLSDRIEVLQKLQACGRAPLAAAVHYGGGASRRRVEKLMEHARALGIRTAATAPIHFLEEADYALHRLVTAIRLNTTVTALPPDSLVSSGAWFRSPERLDRLYGLWPETLDNAAWVAEECNVELSLGKPLFPMLSLQDGETPFSWLWKQTFEGLRKRYRPLTPSVLDRAHYELAIINELGFAPYFLIVADIVNFAKGNDIPAVGRGSAANSVVAYALGITRADPFLYNLYFERFLNRARTDCPDIDLDLCWRGRDRVLEYVYERFGAERVAMVCTHNTFQARSAIREMARALGFTEREIAPITRVLPHYGAEDLRLLLETAPECRRLKLDEEPLKSVITLGERIAGFPRHLSIHAGGMLIAPDCITRHTPLERAPKGLVITQYDKDAIETLGLVKMDLLGHRALSVIHDVAAEIRRTRNPDFDIEALPDPDPASAALLRTGDTLGCFQIESPAMRGLLRKLGADTCESVIQAIALVRPGASGSGMKQHFINRRHGREAVEYPHPSMERALGDTYGVMIYQEDVLKVAHAVAGMDLAEADLLRRAMCKKRSPREMVRNMKRFLEGAAANGVDGATARTIWELIAHFAAYAYCKAHAATYGELACQCVYLKAHYPVEFFSAVLANGGGFYAAPVYVSAAQRCGIPVLPPDVNRSEWTYVRDNDGIRTGFAQMAGFTETCAQNLLAARQKGPFRDFDDLLRRVPLGRNDGEALCQAGALDALPAGENQPPLTRPMQLWRLRNKRVRENIVFFNADVPALPALPDYSARVRADLERKVLGMPLVTHPLRYHAAACLKHPFTASAHLRRYEGRKITVIGLIIAERRLSLRDGRGCMKFLTLEDVWGVFEAVLFPECYQQFGYLSQPGSICACTGIVQCEHGDAVLVVETIK